uniref:NADH-ubiquinone oxidoreductase chain 4L n=1 Tax=Nectonemertes cf. mirabilis HC-2011 TaxID=992350 RepID=I1SR45_9BILA|nr:NADH dehydrogenase subunit 4L [Nectonemertes cf. mirabilis HC-2011]ADZ05365.1 NADH dehydrogenase subunit 4L [Nectonemertes cf. mirabilis HC-2011]
MNFSFLFSFFFFGFLFFLVGFFSFVVQRFHFLMSLLSLELIMLGIFLLVVGSVYEGMDGYLIFVFLVFVICEAAVGLGLLVSFVRSHGSNFMSIVSIFEC